MHNDAAPVVMEAKLLQLLVFWFWFVFEMVPNWKTVIDFYCAIIFPIMSSVS